MKLMRRFLAIALLAVFAIVLTEQSNAGQSRLT